MPLPSLTTCLRGCQLALLSAALCACGAQSVSSPGSRAGDESDVVVMLSGRDVSWQVYSLDEGDVLAVGMERSIDALEARLSSTVIRLFDAHGVLRWERDLGDVDTVRVAAAGARVVALAADRFLLSLDRSDGRLRWRRVGFAGRAVGVSVHRDDIVAAWSGGDVVRYGPRGRLLSLRRGASPPPVAVVDGERGPLVLAHEAGEPHGVLVAYDVSARAPEAIWEAPSDTNRVHASGSWLTHELAGVRVVRDARTGRLLGQLPFASRSSAMLGPSALVTQRERGAALRLLRVSAHGPDDPVDGVRWSAHVLDGAAEPILEASARGVLVRAAGRATYLSAAGATLWSRQEPGAECIWWDASASRALVTCLDGGERVLRFLHPLGRVD